MTRREETRMATTMFSEVRGGEWTSRPFNAENVLGLDGDERTPDETRLDQVIEDVARAIARAVQARALATGATSPVAYEAYREAQVAAESRIDGVLHAVTILLGEDVRNTVDDTARRIWRGDAT